MGPRWTGLGDAPLTKSKAETDGKGIYFREAGTEKTADQRLKDHPQSAENTSRSIGGERAQVGSEGQVHPCLGVSHRDLAGSGQSWLLEGAVSVPSQDAQPSEVPCLSRETSWKEESNWEV